MLEAILLKGGLGAEASAAIAELGCEYLIRPSVGKAEAVVRDQIEVGKSKVRSKLQKARDKILRQELRLFTSRARKKNGDFKQGWNQRKVMSLAQKATTKRMRK